MNTTPKFPRFLFVLVSVLVLASMACTITLQSPVVVTASEPTQLANNNPDAQAPENSAPADDGDQRALGPQGQMDRVQHMLELDKVFRADGAAAWLEAAGMPFDWVPGYFDARQPEEETMSLESGTKIVVYPTNPGLQRQQRDRFESYRL